MEGGLRPQLQPRSLLTQTGESTASLLPADSRSWLLVRRQAAIWIRLSPLLLVISSTVLSAIPSILKYNGAYITQDSMLYKWTIDDLPNVQTVVSIISAAFAFLLTYSSCLCFNLFMRGHIARKHNVFLDNLRFYVAVTNHTTDFSLTETWLILAILWCALNALTAPLWTGALTPQKLVLPKPGRVYVPTTALANQTTYPALQQYDPSANFTSKPWNNTLLTDFPSSLYAGRIVESLSTASTVDGSPRNHTKLDDTSYTYSGRSYGAGVSIGLRPIILDKSFYDRPTSIEGLQSFAYKETGFVAQAECILNASSLWGSVSPFSDTNPTVYTISGHRPNQGPHLTNSGTYTYDDIVPDYSWTYKGFSFPSKHNLSFPIQMVAFSAGSSGRHAEAPYGPFLNGTPPFQLSITAGTDYTFLDQVQCDLSFTLTTLSVKVSAADRIIEVTPDQNVLNATRSPEQNNYIEWTLRGLQAITMVETTLFINSIGAALQNNLLRLGEQLTPPIDDRALGILSQSIEAALDDIMAGQNAFAVIDDENGSHLEETLFYIQVLEIGKSWSRITLLTLNLVWLSIIAGISASTRLFADSPSFNFADLPSMTGAACHRPEDADRSGTIKHLKDWSGDAGDEVLRNSQVEINCESGRPGPPRVLVKPVETISNGS